MASGFPGSTDNFPTVWSQAETQSTDHPNSHSDLSSAVNALQRTLLGQATATSNLTISSAADNNNFPNSGLLTTQTITVGGGQAVPVGILGQVVINSGSHDHSIGVAGRCLPTATSPLGNGYYGMEGRVDMGRTGGIGYGVLGLASVSNASSNSGSIVIGLRGRAEVLVGTSTGATMYGGWFTTNAPAGPVGSTYANAIFGDMTNNVSTRFRGAAGSGQAEGLVTVLSTGTLEVDVTDSNLSLGMKIKLGSAGSSRIAITNSANTEVVSIFNTGAMTVGGTLQIGSRPAFVASDRYLVVDASGNVHVSALGPAS